MDLLGLILAVEITLAVFVLVYTVTEDIVTWFADRRIRALRERERAMVAEIETRAQGFAATIDAPRASS